MHAAAIFLLREIACVATQRTQEEHLRLLKELSLRAMQASPAFFASAHVPQQSLLRGVATPPEERRRLATTVSFRKKSALARWRNSQ
jgi:hypothetical protein